MIEARNNYIHHTNRWWWGETTTLISKDGYASVELQIEDNSFVGVVRGLIVFTLERKKHYATEMMQCIEDIAREKGMKHLQLNASNYEAVRVWEKACRRFKHFKRNVKMR